MSPLFTYNGNLLVRDGQLASHIDCCCPSDTGCMQCYCFCDADMCAGSPQGTRKFQKTISVPESFSLPVKVTIVGGVDDVLMIDGDGSVFGQDPSPVTGTPAHSFNYTWTQNNRTFTVEALDTQSVCMSLAYTLCIMAVNTTPTTQCGPIIVLSDNTNCIDYAGSQGVPADPCPSETSSSSSSEPSSSSSS